MEEEFETKRDKWISTLRTSSENVLDYIKKLIIEHYDGLIKFPESIGWGVDAVIKGISFIIDNAAKFLGLYAAMDLLAGKLTFSAAIAAIPAVRFSKAAITATLTSIGIAKAADEITTVPIQNQAEKDAKDFNAALIKARNLCIDHINNYARPSIDDAIKRLVKDSTDSARSIKSYETDAHQKMRSLIDFVEYQNGDNLDTFKKDIQKRLINFFADIKYSKNPLMKTSSTLYENAKANIIIK